MEDIRFLAFFLAFFYYFFLDDGPCTVCYPKFSSFQTFTKMLCESNILVMLHVGFCITVLQS